MLLSRDPREDDDQRLNRVVLVLAPLAVIASLVALYLLLDNAPSSAPTARTHPRRTPGEAGSRRLGLDRGERSGRFRAPEPRVARRAAREFLTGYLAVVYGRGSVSDIEHAAPPLRAELERDPPRVTPAQAAQRPGLRALTIRIAPDGAVWAIAQVEAERSPSYRLELRLQRVATYWTVVEVGPR